MKKINRRTRALILTFVLALILTGIYALGIWIPDEAAAGSFLNSRQPPSWEHPFGTDALGRDLFIRTLKGMAVSMTVGFSASVMSAVIAVFVGMAAAAGFRYADAFVCWLIDLVMGVPHTVLVILISFSMGRGLKGLLVGIAATHWCSLARLIRGEVLKQKSEPYIAVSRKLGKSDGWIFIHHLLPHLVPQFFTGLVLLFPHAVLHEASISFLGFGLPPEQPAIGIILSESMRYLSAGMWWPAVIPGFMLVMIVLLVDQMGEHLQVILDPYRAQE
ncbi:MAG: ABC transporter permease [Eubacterium sp.]|nr:ABC transporter permease [Eubacterium sp.]